MENILWDMIQADRFSAQFISKDSSSVKIKLETIKLYEQIFRLHGTSKEEFVKSYRYYLNRPDITKVMFDSLSVQANKKKKDVYKSVE